MSMKKSKEEWKIEWSQISVMNICRSAFFSLSPSSSSHSIFYFISFSCVRKAFQWIREKEFFTAAAAACAQMSEWEVEKEIF